MLPKLQLDDVALHRTVQPHTIRHRIAPHRAIDWAKYVVL